MRETLSPFPRSATSRREGERGASGSVKRGRRERQLPRSLCLISYAIGGGRADRSFVPEHAPDIRSPKVPISQIRSIASDNAMRLIGIFSMTSNGLEVTQLPRENPAGGKLANKTPHQVQLRRCNRRRGPSAYWAWSGIGTIGTCHR